MYLLLLSRIDFSHFLREKHSPMSSVCGEMAPISRGETVTSIKTEHRGSKSACSDKKNTLSSRMRLWHTRSPKMEGNIWFNIIYSF